MRESYWTLPPPLGMRGVPISDIIDIDEAYFFLDIWIKGTARLFCANAAVRMVCKERGEGQSPSFNLQ
jgi:hypothetical protein